MSFWKVVLYQPLLNLLIIFYNFLGNNMGMAIIALTLLVRLFMLPTTLKSMLAQKKLKEIQPEIEKIRKDHGHDKQKLTQATLELYQKHGVNPFSSCLPLLIQLPIFIALYRVFLGFSQMIDKNMLYGFVHKPELINKHFLWLDLSKPDHLYILPILAGLTLFWQTKMTTWQPPKQPKQDNQDKKEQMEHFQETLSNQMLYLFPLMTVFIAIKLPSALSLYWVVTTFFGIIQQYLLFKGKIPSFKKSIVTTIKKRE